MPSFPDALEVAYSAPGPAPLACGLCGLAGADTSYVRLAAWVPVNEPAHQACLDKLYAEAKWFGGYARKEEVVAEGLDVTEKHS